MTTDRNPIQKVYDRLVDEARKRSVVDMEMSFDRPAQPDGWWWLDIFIGIPKETSTHYIVMWREGLIDGFGVCDPDPEPVWGSGPDRFVPDEDAVVAWLWP